jgi:hypothetical protein
LRRSLGLYVDEVKNIDEVENIRKVELQEGSAFYLIVEETHESQEMP